MKTTQLLLILALLSYCFSQDTDDCYNQFEAILEQKCKLIDPKCGYSKEIQTCGRECSTGTESDCSGITPPNSAIYMCNFDTSSRTCKQVEKNCQGYNEENCSKMKPSTSNNNRCDILSQGAWCRSYSNDCPTSPAFNPSDQTTCTDHIPYPYTKKCKVTSHSTDGTTTYTCDKVNRNCGDNFYKMDKNICHQLTSTTTGKQCFYTSDKTCVENYEGCKGYDSSSLCNSDKHPLIRTNTDDGYDFDYSKTCFWKTNDGTGECVTRDRKCYEFDETNEDEERCLQLKATDPNKKECLYDDSRTTDKCYEEYQTCQLYNDNENIKTREECERIKPVDSTKLCYFNEEENKCEERDIFNTCDDYKGNDKNICESIISKETNSRCILEKDSICKERTFYCEDTNIKYQCLTYAKARDPNKKCVFNSNSKRCLEVYKSCEDYYTIDGITSSSCSSLHLYNGKGCSYELNRCFTKTNLTCDEVYTEEECILIAKSGVIDPDKLVCQWNSGVCKENYKYCSDYRGNNDITCRNIKPYDESGEKIDIFSHCDIDPSTPSVGCKRYPNECTDYAGSDEFKCASISPYIKDNKIKYCAIDISGNCKEFYKTCEDASPNECSNNIPQNYSNTICEIKTDNGVESCHKKDDCTQFTSSFYSSLCYSIDSKCIYENSRCKTKSEKTCQDIQFYIQNDDNEEVCKSYEVSDPNKVCSLKDDKLGCEEVDREANVTSSETTNQGNSSKFISKGISLTIIILLSLLI